MQPSRSLRIQRSERQTSEPLFHARQNSERPPEKRITRFRQKHHPQIRTSQVQIREWQEEKRNKVYGQDV